MAGVTSSSVRTRDGQALSTLGVGCSRIGSFNNPTPPREIQAMLEEALAAGVNLFDTADIYGQGDSERALGALLRNRPADAFVVTKIGKRFSTRMRLARPFKPVLKALLPAAGRGAVTAAREANMNADFSPARFPAAVESSLRRLGMDSLDGLLLHSPPASVLADPAVARALLRLTERSLVRFWGASVDTLAELEAAARMPGLSLLQIPYDLILAVEDQPLAGDLRERGVTVFAREVVRLQPGRSAPAAAAAAAAHPLVDCVIVGMSTRTHLRELTDSVQPQHKATHAG
jgi:aryl-alcohol dehydrogenase-like predicted oxidoreductase